MGSDSSINTIKQCVKLMFAKANNEEAQETERMKGGTGEKKCAGNRGLDVIAVRSDHSVTKGRRA